MSIFDNREKAFEDKFAHDAELNFKITEHAAHLFGLWVAAKLSLAPAEAEAYAQKAMTSMLMPKGYVGLIAKAEKNLRAQKVMLDRRQLEQQFEYLRQIAHEEVMGSGKIGNASH